jgi:hypothetical protein
MFRGPMEINEGRHGEFKFLQRRVLEDKTFKMPLMHFCSVHRPKGHARDHERLTLVNVCGRKWAKDDAVPFDVAGLLRFQLPFKTDDVPALVRRFEGSRGIREALRMGGYNAMIRQPSSDDFENPMAHAFESFEMTGRIELMDKKLKSIRHGPTQIYKRWGMQVKVGGRIFNVPYLAELQPRERYNVKTRRHDRVLAPIAVPNKYGKSLFNFVCGKYKINSETTRDAIRDMYILMDCDRGFGDKSVHQLTYHLNTKDVLLMLHAYRLFHYDNPHTYGVNSDIRDLGERALLLVNRYTLCHEKAEVLQERLCRYVQHIRREYSGEEGVLKGIELDIFNNTRKHMNEYKDIERQPENYKKWVPKHRSPKDQ